MMSPSSPMQSKAKIHEKCWKPKKHNIQRMQLINIVYSNNNVPTFMNEGCTFVEQHWEWTNYNFEQQKMTFQRPETAYKKCWKIVVQNSRNGSK